LSTIHQCARAERRNPDGGGRDVQRGPKEVPGDIPSGVSRDRQWVSGIEHTSGGSRIEYSRYTLSLMVPVFYDIDASVGYVTGPPVGV
jgi:hypothetical protein